jgi:spore germination protein KC
MILYKKIYVFILCFIMLVALSGCLGGREINDLEIVIGMGIDKDKDTGDILLTAQIVNEKEAGGASGEGGGGGGKAYWNVNSIGKSIFDAARQITHKTGNRLFVSHNQVVIFGHDVAAEGLQKHIDFFLRAHEMRPTTLILVAEGRASDIMDAKPETERFPAMNITKLVKTYGFTSHLYKVNMKDFATCLMSGTSATFAPLVTVSQDRENKDVFVPGMAVFKNGKMVGKLNHDEVRGVLWVLGKVESGVVIVPSPDGKGKAVLEIVNAKSKVKPEIKDGRIIFHIKIEEELSLSEQTTRENLATVPGFGKVQEAAGKVVRQEIMAAFERSKELRLDIFGFGEMLHKKYKNEWKIMEHNWDDIYPTIELDIHVDSRIVSNDLLRRPASPDEGGE